MSRKMGEKMEIKFEEVKGKKLRYLEMDDGRKLPHMTESALRMPNASYELLSISDVSTSLKESMRSTVKSEHFTESDNDGALKAAIRMRESALESDKADFDKIIKKLREGSASTERKLWKFPISRFGNVNGNGRIYSKELWENVINKQRDSWVGSYGLADHPMDDSDPGQFKNAAIVWLDMMIDEANKLIWAIGTFVGTYGRLAQEIIEAGGRVGFSSSGFGETLMDGKTINPDTYILERPADIVTNPSQSVFGDASNESYNPGNVEYSKQTIESVETSRNRVVESAPKSNIVKGKTMTVDAVKMDEAKKPNVGPVAIDKLTKKVIEKQVESMINDTDKSSNPASKLSEVNELLSMVRESQDAELIAKVEEKLVATRDELFALCESASKVQAEFGDLTAMAENTKKAVVTGKLLAEQIEDYKVIAEALEEKVQSLSKENNILKAKLAIKENKEKAAAEAAKLRECEDAKKAEADKCKDEECNNLKEMVAKLNKANRKLESETGVLKTRLNHAAAQMKAVKESADAAKADAAKAKEDTNKMKESRDGYRRQVIDLQTKLRESASMLDAAKVQFEEYKEAHQEKLSFKPAEKDYVSKYLNMRENRGLDVENYWNDLLTQYGESVLPFERQIRGAKTYNEAFSAFMKYRTRIDEAAGAAAAATIDSSVSSLKERANILAEAGMTKVDESIEDINAYELEKMRKMGLM